MWLEHLLFGAWPLIAVTAGTDASFRESGIASAGCFPTAFSYNTTANGPAASGPCESCLTILEKINEVARMREHAEHEKLEYKARSNRSKR